MPVKSFSAFYPSPPPQPLSYTTPELVLVGAGPGDPDLITVKGQRTLNQARVVLFDNLANQALLELTPPNCEKIYVGKLPYGAYTPQDKIHRLIREKAFQYGQVIRLKGGDPFIFGRGFEEVLYARSQGIAVSYIPGISSMQTAGLSNIPLTHRQLSESIWIVTATRKDGAFCTDLRIAIHSKATIVIYMGMKQLPEITRICREEGFAHIPAAIIQNASLPHQRIVTGTAGELHQLATIHGLTHPSIILIGEVVRLTQAATTETVKTETIINEKPRDLPGHSLAIAI